MSLEEVRIYEENCIKEEPLSDTDHDLSTTGQDELNKYVKESLDAPVSCKEEPGLFGDSIKSELDSELLDSLENACISLEKLYETQIKQEISLEFSCCIQQIVLQDCMVRLERLPIASCQKFHCDLSLARPRFFDKKDEKISRKKFNKYALKVNDNEYICHLCNKQFKKRTAIIKHILAHTKKPYYCPICQKKFDYPSSLLSHKLSHSGEKRFKCELCDKKCSTKANLKKHVLNHINDLPFSCEFCNKQFIRERFLINHLRTHTGEKPFECEICGKQLKYKSSLKDHLQTHPFITEKQHSCEFCEFKATRKSHLIIHERKHTGEKPFACEVCNNNFTSKSTLNSHMRLHTGKLYTCNLCPMGFLTRGKLWLHKQNHLE